MSFLDRFRRGSRADVAGEDLAGSRPAGGKIEGELQPEPPKAARASSLALFVGVAILLLLLGTIWTGLRRSSRIEVTAAPSTTAPSTQSEQDILEELRRRFPTLADDDYQAQQNRLEAMKQQYPDGFPVGGGDRNPTASPSLEELDAMEAQNRAYQARYANYGQPQRRELTPEEKALRAPLRPKSGSSASTARAAAPASSAEQLLAEVEATPIDHPILAAYRDRIVDTLSQHRKAMEAAYAVQTDPKAPAADPDAVVIPGGASGVPAASALAGHGQGWLRGPGGAPPVLLSAVHAPTTPYLLQQGAVLPAVLETAVNSDLPGQVSAIVRANVYDSLYGHYLLIPQGTRLLGEYASTQAFGQNRLLMAWNRLIFPDGRTLDLGGQPAVDALGAAGAADKVNHHFGRVFGSALLVSVIGAGADLARGDRTLLLEQRDVQELMASNLADEWERVATEYLRKNIDLEPTIILRNGLRFGVSLTQDVVLPGPYLDARGAAEVDLVGAVGGRP